MHDEPTLPGAETQPTDSVTTTFEPVRGMVVGRYVVLSRLGAGGMGVVYAAYDPELDRKVALKFLLPGGGGSEGRTRLLREAQALAKLQHPNVVTIHDVGTHEGRVWLAMEFVAGATLAAWRAETSRPWPEVLEVMLSAGRGVAAAHAAGLLHRDIKPDNIMVGHDGRVRVMDFGLVRAQDDDLVVATGSTQQDIAGQPRVETSMLRVTQAGQLLGTPAYMAAEQVRGDELGPATDQFSFCVTLWEALYGLRPFTGDSVMDLVVAVLDGNPTPPPRGANVPRWLRRVLDRGLSVAPDERWPSMDALLEMLQRGRARARLRRGLAAMGVVALSAAGVAGWHELDRRQRVAACAAEGASIADVWNDDVEAKIRESLVATGVSNAETTAAKLTPWLDEQVSAWKAARTDVCLDAKVHATWDGEMHERGSWCLDERRMELEALVLELTRADAQVVHRAVSAAAGLLPVDPCRDTNLLRRLPPPPTEQRGAIRAARADLSRVDALGGSGKYDEGLDAARALVTSVESIAWPRLSAAAHASQAILLSRTGAYEEAERTGADAYYEAARVGAWDVAARVSTQLVYVSGYLRARHAEGLAWGRHAEVALSHAGDVAQVGEARRLGNVANVRAAMGAYEEARALYERALAIQGEGLGPEHPDVALTLNNLANVHAAAGASGEARVLYERALAIRERVLGPEHPDVAKSLSNLAGVHLAAGEHAEAQALLEQSLFILESALGPEHPEVAANLDNLAGTYWAPGAHEEARALYERALTIREKVLGPEHPAVAMNLANLAGTYGAMGAHEEARALHERALAIREKTLGPEHPEFAASLLHLSDAHRATGDFASWAALVERAVAIYDRHDGTQHLELEARFSLAEALIATEGDRSLALRLAAQARDGYRAAGEGRASDLEAVDAWLAEHAG
jgi:eukaryotic-like serine/threonine-protein kinase